LTYSLPTQLSPRNIPGLIPGAHVYRIYTTQADYDSIRANSAFQNLRAAIRVETIFIDGELQRDSSLTIGQKYEVKSNCYRQAFAAARNCGAAVVPSNADIVFADGFVTKLQDLVAEGKRAVQVPGPRGVREPIGQALLSRYKATNGAIVIDVTELASLWLRHIHPLLEMHFVEGPEGGRFNPSHLYWRVANEGIIARCFNLHPYIVYPKDAVVDFSTTVDDDLIEQLRLRDSERFIALDSREIFCCELSPPEQYVGDLARRGDLQRYVEVYASYCEHNIRNLEKEILIPCVNSLGPEWRFRRASSRAFIRDLLNRYRLERRRRAREERAARYATALDHAATRLKATVSKLPPFGLIVRRIIPEPLKPMLRRIRAALFRSKPL
jgi:hypothetical protein